MAAGGAATMSPVPGELLFEQRGLSFLWRPFWGLGSVFPKTTKEHAARARTKGGGDWRGGSRAQ